MSRFDVYVRAGGGPGYMLDVQADILRGLTSRVVVPLALPQDAPRPARSLNPVFQIDGKSHLMLTQFIGTVPAKQLRNPVLSLEDRSDDIMRALDFLLIGF